MSSYWKAFVDPLQATVERIISFVPRFMIAFVIFCAFYCVAMLIRHLLRKSLRRLVHLPATIRILIIRAIYILIIFFGLLVALSAADVNLTGIIASLGVAGFALGFALKDILENFIAGILLLFSRPFEIGDQVTLGTFEGTVTDIELRITTLRTYAGEKVAIPNAKIYTNAVINHTALGKRLYTVSFDTSLTADGDLVREKALKAAQENESVAKDPPPAIRISKMESGNDILSWKLVYWADATRAVEMKTISEVLTRVKQDLFDAGVPTPTATNATIYRREHPEATQVDDESQEN